MAVCLKYSTIFGFALTKSPSKLNSIIVPRHLPGFGVTSFFLMMGLFSCTLMLSS